jgi:hypothetical protein
VFAAQQGVQQGGLAGVGAAPEGAETGFHYLSVNQGR